MVGLLARTGVRIYHQGNTIHCSKSESLSTLGFFAIDALAFAAAALGVLEAAEVTIGEESESESEDSLSSLPALEAGGTGLDPPAAAKHLANSALCVAEIFL